MLSVYVQKASDGAMFGDEGDATSKESEKDGMDDAGFDISYNGYMKFRFTLLQALKGQQFTEMAESKHRAMIGDTAWKHTANEAVETLSKTKSKGVPILKPREDLTFMTFNMDHNDRFITAECKQLYRLFKKYRYVYKNSLASGDNKVKFLEIYDSFKRIFKLAAKKKYVVLRKSKEASTNIAGLIPSIHKHIV